jgi:hypothetical protein
MATQRARHHPTGCHAPAAVQTDIRLQVAYIPVRHSCRPDLPASGPPLEQITIKVAARAAGAAATRWCGSSGSSTDADFPAARTWKGDVSSSHAVTHAHLR